MRPKPVYGLVACASLAFIGAIAWVTTSHSDETKKVQPTSVLRITPNPTQVYQFEMVSDVELDLDWLGARVSGRRTAGTKGSGKPTKIHADASGQLHLHFFRSDDGDLSVAGMLQGVHFLTNGEPVDMRDVTERPFVFQLSELGYIREIQFVKGSNEYATRFTRQLLYAMQVGLPKEPKSAWRTYEVDSIGRYAAQYRRRSTDRDDEIEILKSPVEYSSVGLESFGVDKVMPGTQVVLKGSETRVTMPRFGGLPLAYEGKTSNRLLDGAHEWGSSEGRFKAQALDIPVTAELPETLEVARAKVADLELLKKSFYEIDPSLADADSYRDINDLLQALVPMLSSKKSSERARAENLIVDYLRRHPMAAASLIDVLDRSKNSEVDESTQLVLWRLVTKAGHAEAQKAVLDAAIDPKRSELTHTRALAYVHDFEAPGEPLIDGLWQNVDSLQDSKTAAAQRERKMSLYALGAIDGNSNVEAKVGERVAERLAGGLEKSLTPNDQIAYLDAIGNAGREDLLDAVEPHLTSSDDDVRAHAFSALRRMPPEVATDALTRHYDIASSTKVKAAALRALEEMPASHEMSSWVSDQLHREGDERIRIELIRILGRTAKTNPGHATILQGLLAENVSPAVRREIYRYIAPQ